MGRHEDPLAPGPLFEFARDLRALRAATGRTYRDLARRAGYSASALSAAAKGEVLPTLDVTLAYVGACGADAAEWERRWRELATPEPERRPARSVIKEEIIEPVIWTPGEPGVVQPVISIPDEPEPLVPEPVEPDRKIIAAVPPPVPPPVPVVPAVAPNRGLLRARRLTAAAVVVAVAGVGLALWRITDGPASPGAAPQDGRPAATNSQNSPATTASNPASSRSPAGAATSPAGGGAPGATSQGTPQRQAQGGGGQPGVNGGGGQVPNPEPVPAQGPSRAPVVAQPVTFSHTVGEDCPRDSVNRTWDSGSDAWGRHTGGWSGDGCTGTFVSAQVSGGNAYFWTMATGQVTNGSCGLSVYVPAGGNLDNSTSAGYLVMDGSPSGSRVQVGGFTVNQQANQGIWVSAGGFPIHTGHIEVELTADRSGSGTIAASAIHATCTA